MKLIAIECCEAGYEESGTGNLRVVTEPYIKVVQGDMGVSMNLAKKKSWISLGCRCADMLDVWCA